MTQTAVPGNHNNFCIPDVFSCKGTVQWNFFYRKRGNTIRLEQAVVFRPLLWLNRLFRQAMQPPCGVIELDNRTVFITNNNGFFNIVEYCGQKFLLAFKIIFCLLVIRDIQGGERHLLSMIRHIYKGRTQKHIYETPVFSLPAGFNCADAMFCYLIILFPADEFKLGITGIEYPVASADQFGFFISTDFTHAIVDFFNYSVDNRTDAHRRSSEDTFYFVLTRSKRFLNFVSFLQMKCLQNNDN